MLHKKDNVYRLMLTTRGRGGHCRHQGPGKKKAKVSPGRGSAIRRLAQAAAGPNRRLCTKLSRIMHYYFCRATRTSLRAHGEGQDSRSHFGTAVAVCNKRTGFSSKTSVTPFVTPFGSRSFHCSIHCSIRVGWTSRRVAKSVVALQCRQRGFRLECGVLVPSWASCRFCPFVPARCWNESGISTRRDRSDFSGQP